jgi:hypothetical protein
MPGGQYINHFGQVRMRLLGSGVMSAKLISLSESEETNLADTTMQLTSVRYVNLHANFEQQKAQLELKTTEFGATFQLRQIIFYLKPVGTNYPQ